MSFGPQAGDKLVLTTDAARELGLDLGQKEVVALAIFESLDVDWGSWGELAWAQRDADDMNEQKGSYYAVCSHPGVEGETFSVASYEVFAWTGG